jgi:hypothetical protein
MGTGIPARSSGDQTINYLRAPVTFAMGNSGIVNVGTLPAGCVVLRAYIIVTTAFNAGTNNFLKVGISSSDATILSTVTVSTAGVIATTSALATATAATTNPTADTLVICTSLMTGTVATAGAGVVVVEYAPVA